MHATNHFVDIEAIAQRAKIAVLKTGMWRPVRKHRAETAAERERHGQGVDKVTVRLSKDPDIAKLNSIHANARIAHMKLTTPTVMDGMRLLPYGREFEHSNTMARFADEHNEVSARLIAKYPAIKAEAPKLLNGLYDPKMWPASIDDEFLFECKVYPCPTDGAWAEWLLESANSAETEVRERLREAITRVHDRCASDGPLYQSVFDSIRELTALVPDLNFAQSGEIADLAKAASHFGRYSKNEVVKDTTLRGAIVKDAEDILARFGGLK